MTTLKSKIAKAGLGLVAAASVLLGAGSAMAYTFTAPNLQVGSTGVAVMELQKVLNSNPATALAVTPGSAGSIGNESMYFGMATKAAVVKFQAWKAISPTSGLVGPLTRAVLNSGGSTGGTYPAGCTSSTGYSVTTGQSCSGGTTTPQTGPVTAMLSTDNPASGTLISGSAGADLAHVTFTGSGVVTSVTLTRGGVSTSSTLSNVYLYDGATRITDGYSFNTAGTLTMNGLGIMVNGSKTIAIKADVSVADYSVSITLSSYTVGGTSTAVSVKGNEMYIASGTGLLGTANFTSTSPSPTATNINAGSMNQTLWSNSLSIGLHASKLYGMTVKMIGSAPSTTLANVALYVDGTSVATSMINANGQFVFTLGTPLSLSTGAHFFEIRGDVVAGAFRSFYLSLEKAADLTVMDGQVQGGGVVTIAPTYLTGTLNNVNGGLVTVNNGTLTITQDPAFSNTTSLVGGSTTTKLGAWKFSAYGEDVKVNTLTFTPTFTSLSAGTTLQNVGLYVNGGQVGSNATATTATPLIFNNLGSNLIVTAGMPAVVELRGDIVSNSPAGTAITSGTVKFDLAAGSSNAQGVSSSQLTSTSSSAGQSLTIGNNVTFGATAGFSTSTKAPNSTAVKIGSFALSAGSAEGLTVTSVSVTLPAGGSNTMQPANQLTNLTVKVGSQVVGTPIGNPVITTSNSFSTNMTVAQGTAAIFDVYADFGSSAATLTVTPSLAVSYRGAVSNLSATTSTVVGSTTTSNVAVIAVGNVKVNTGLSLSARNVVTSSSFPIATYNFKSNGVAGAVIKDVTFSFPLNTVTSITMNGKTQGSISGTSATIYNVGVTVPATSDGVDVPVTVGLVCTGTANGCSANSPVSVYLLATTVTYNDGAVVQSITPTSGPATTVTHFVYASVPSFAVDTVQKTGLTLGTENKIGEVTISADLGGQIKVNNIAFNIATSGITSPVFSGARIADGSTTIPGSSVSSGCTAVGACVMTLGTSPSGFAIAAGTSKTFSLFANVAGTPIASTVLTVSSSVTRGTTTWDDSVGGATAQTAANTYNFPTGSYSIRQ